MSSENAANEPITPRVNTARSFLAILIFSHGWSAPLEDPEPPGIEREGRKRHHRFLLPVVRGYILKWPRRLYSSEERFIRAVDRDHELLAAATTGICQNAIP